MLAYENKYLPNYTYADYKEWEGDWELIYGIPYAMSPAPKIIFEVLSPSTKTKDRNFKFLLYAQSGVKYYILVEPAGMFAEVYKLTHGKYRLEGEFKEQSYSFDLDNECNFDFSFKEVFNI